MLGLSDQELLNELKRRFEENARSLSIIESMHNRIKKINEKLTQAEELKTNFLSNIRNEINNPLSSIMLLADCLIKNADMTPEEISRNGRMIHSEAFNLDFQLRTIFAAAALEAGEFTGCPSPCDMGVLIQDVVEAFECRAKEKRLTFKQVIDSEDTTPFVVHTDSELLDLAISNLVANAIEYNHEDGCIEIKVWRHGCYLNISVTDQGEGIDIKDHKRIFDRFVQLETGSTRSHPGSGLGLSVTKALVEILNGTITIQSEQNSGSTFTISVPENEEEDRLVAFSNHGCDFFDEEQVF